MTISEIVKAVFSLKNVRRAPGDAGKLKGFTDIIRETETDFYIQRNGTASPWPGSLYIVVRNLQLWHWQNLADAVLSV